MSRLGSTTAIRVAKRLARAGASSSRWLPGRWRTAQRRGEQQVSTSVDSSRFNNSLLGQPPGGGGSSFPNLPGTRGNPRRSSGSIDAQGHPHDGSRRPGLAPDRRTYKCRFPSPQPAPVSPTTTPFYGTLEIAAEDDDGPPDGMTLDQAIDITLERSLDLREAPRDSDGARRHSAGQLAVQPRLLSGRPAPPVQGRRARSSRARPRAVPASLIPTSPIRSTFRTSGRHGPVVATRAERVLEALYQDAVRQRIDDVYGALRHGPGGSPDGPLREAERRQATSTSRNETSSASRRAISPWPI